MWESAKGQNLGHLYKVVFFFLLFYYENKTDTWSDISQPCDIDLKVMKWRSAWPIFHTPVILSYHEEFSQSSDFALYLED